MSRLQTAALALALACAAPARAAGPYDDLLKHAPSNTNVVVLIDTGAAFDSALAKKEKWAEARAGGQGILGFVPTDAELLAITAEVNLTSMTRDFQVGLVKVGSVPNFKDLATAEGGTMVEIAGQITTVSPRDVYFTSFPGKIFAAASPADRQYIARWLRAHNADKLSPLSPYLRKAADGAAGKTVTIAVDLEDVLDPALVQLGLAWSPIMVKNKGLNLNQRGLAVCISRAKGLTFTAQVTDGVVGKIVVEFPEDANRYRAVLKDLFLELVDSFGIAIDGLDQWEATVTDTSLTLSGSMSSADLKRLVSLFAFPQPGVPEPGAAADGDKPTAGATRRYLDAADSILADVRKLRESTNYEKTATWHDRTAAQLGMINRRNVDPLAVEAVHQCAQKLRAIGDSLRGVPIAVTEAQQKAYVVSNNMGLWGAGLGWWGGGRRGALMGLAFSPNSVETNLPEIQKQIAKVIADDKQKRVETWSAIDRLLMDTRQKLADKYKEKF